MLENFYYNYFFNPVSTLQSCFRQNFHLMHGKSALLMIVRFLNVRFIDTFLIKV